MSYSPRELLQGQKAAPQPRFLGAHPNLEVIFQVSRAIQRQPQEVDGFRALSAAFARVSLREPTKLDQFGLGRMRLLASRRRLIRNWLEVVWWHLELASGVSGC